MKFKSDFLKVTICLVFFTGCIGPLVPVIDMANVDPQALQASQRIRIYQSEKLPPSGYREIGPVKAWSCKNKTWEPAATKENAIKQLKIVAHRLGATAIMDVEAGQRSTSMTNCWNVVVATGMAIKY
jgi:uncharacterized protein YbjQ (UPF0145 family)